ncbi:MAG TPA: hypothetical protein VNX01_09650 [Bacteroidia bacterium]|jgi:hypothetical protein|nr:hypothetical protein [Bacteroidia bacterium]
MNSYELLTKADFAEFEKKFLSKISDLFSEIPKQKNLHEGDKYLSRKQVMQLFSISTNTLTLAVEEGLPYIMIGKRPRYSRKAIIKHLEGKNKFGV